jgi:hypothetical protein
MANIQLDGDPGNYYSKQFNEEGLAYLLFCGSKKPGTA